MAWYFGEYSRFLKLNRKKIIHGAAGSKVHTVSLVDYIQLRMKLHNWQHLIYYRFMLNFAITLHNGISAACYLITLY